VGNTEVKVNIKRSKGANLHVCEDTVNFCPYCGSKRIRELGKNKSGDSHIVSCDSCAGLFSIPCED
jgi:predicted RNA-binding Zn-ribbon protein involved in translation (DUF1610 family)